MRMPAANASNKSKYLKGGHKGERPLLMKPLASTALKSPHLVGDHGVAGEEGVW